MPQMTVDLSIDKLAETINHMTDEERESLSLLLSEHGAELKSRKDDIEQNTVTTLSEDEVFGE